MKKEIEKIVEEIMQEGFDVAMGGNPFKSQEQNKEIQERKYDEAIGKWSKIIEKAIQQERERVIDKIVLMKHYTGGGSIEPKDLRVNLKEVMDIINN